MTWLPVTYDPELNLIYVGTGNPQPVVAARTAQGDNLFTASIVALNPDTGKMAWYFQASPHDTHDWDATQTPVLFDGEFNGQPRKLLAQAQPQRPVLRARSHERQAHRHQRVRRRPNWAKGLDAKGQPIPNPAKEPQIDGALVSPNQGGATNWPPPSFSPLTGLFYVSAARRPSASCTSTTRATTRRAGAAPTAAAMSESMLQAIDYKTGKVRWSHKWEGGGTCRALSRPPATCSSPAATPTRSSR